MKKTNKRQDAKVLEFNKNKKKKQRKSRPQSRPELTVINGGKSRPRMIRKICLGVGIVLVIGITAALNLLSPTGITEWIQTKIALIEGGNGFPVSVSDAITQNLYQDDGRLLLLTETDLKCYNTSGNLIYSRIHGYANPVVRTSAMRTLLFDRSGSQYKIENPSKTIYSGDIEETIITGDIGDSGYYALATEAEDDVAQVTVYNRNNESVYRYYSSDQYVSGVSISDNGKYLAVAVVSTENAMLSSKLMLFDLSETEPVVQRTFSDEMIYLCEFSGNNVGVLTNKRYCNINPKDEYNEYAFGGKLLNKYAMSDGNALLCLAADSNAAENTVILLDSSAQVKKQFSVQYEIYDIYHAGALTYVLSDQLYVYGADGTMQTTITVESGALAVCSAGKKAVVLYSTGMTAYDV